MVHASYVDFGGLLLPSVYEEFLDLFGWIQLNFVQLIPINCMHEETFSHIDALLLETLTPLGKRRPPAPPLTPP